MRGLFLVGATTLVTVMASSILAEPWKVEVDASVMLTQNAYSDSWVGGEVGVLSWTFNSNSLAEKQLHAKVNNKNTLKFSFGQTHTQDGETKNWVKPTKSADLIDLESLFRFTLGAFVDPFGSGRMQSRFLDASDPTKNRFVNPITFTEALGVARVLIREEKREWTSRLGLGLRQHMNRDVLVDLAADKRETKTTNDGGLVFETNFKSPLAKERISLTSNLQVFQALFYSEADALKGLPDEDYWKAPDINWESIFSASITKYLMVNLYLQLLYDKQIHPRGRFKQTLSLGATYKLI